MNKAVCQEMHFYERFFQRTGDRIGMVDYIQLKDQITNGTALNIKRQSNRVVIKGITYKGKVLLVVYDKKRKTMVSVLPSCDPLYKKIKGVADIWLKLRGKPWLADCKKALDEIDKLQEFELFRVMMLKQISDALDIPIELLTDDTPLSKLESLRRVCRDECVLKQNPSHSYTEGMEVVHE